MKAATELAFSRADPSHPLASITHDEGCSVELLATANGLDHPTGFFEVNACSPRRFQARIDECEKVIDATVIESKDDNGVVEITTQGDCIVSAFRRANAVLTSFTAEAGDIRLVSVLPPYRDPNEVINSVRRADPTVELIEQRKRSFEKPTITNQSYWGTFKERLTPRQWEILRTAYEAGYFDHPRRATQQDVADELGITQATLSEHLQSAQWRLFSLLFN